MDFGDIIWIAVLVLSAFGGSIGKLFRAVGSNQENNSPAMDAEQTPYSDDEEESAWDQAEVFGGISDPYSATSYEAPAYFSYETAEPQPKETMAPKAETKKTPEPIPEIEQQRDVADEPFDLRKAIIYQTIMTNNYIADLK